MVKILRDAQCGKIVRRRKCERLPVLILVLEYQAGVLVAAHFCVGRQWLGEAAHDGILAVPEKRSVAVETQGGGGQYLAVPFL